MGEEKSFLSEFWEVTHHFDEMKATFGNINSANNASWSSPSVAAALFFLHLVPSVAVPEFPRQQLGRYTGSRG